MMNLTKMQKEFVSRTNITATMYLDCGEGPYEILVIMSVETPCGKILGNSFGFRGPISSTHYFDGALQSIVNELKEQELREARRRQERALEPTPPPARTIRNGF